MKRLLRFPYRLSNKALRVSLRYLEHRKIASSTRELKYPPIFVVGPPRSGTTLFYQLMIHRFHLAYFPNVANRYRESPVTATRFALKFCKPHTSDFTSSYGLVDGGMAPHEAGSVWNRWYPTEGEHGYNYTGAGYFDRGTKHIIYQTVAGMEELFDAPFINKNVKNSVRIRSIAEMFPEALFIQMRRNVFDVANSILESRKEIRHDVKDWWSVMPKEIERLKNLNCLEQVCGQVFYVEKNIKEDIAVVDREKAHVLHYEELCDHPKKELDKVLAFMNANGCNIRIKYDVPESFKRSRHKRDPLDSEKETIKGILGQYYGAEGLNGDF